jgi:hypothetical protein
MFDYNGANYGGNYHTENGQVTSIAFSSVVQAANGGWKPNGATEISVFGQSSGSSPMSNEESLTKTINNYGFLTGTFFGGIETGFEQGVRSPERLNVLTGQAKNGTYITEYRNAVSLSNKSAYTTAGKSTSALKWGGRIFAGGIIAYNAADLAVNGGTNQDIAKFAVQSTIAGIGFLGPIGFGVSLGLTLAEMNGGFNWVYNNFDSTKVNKIGN